MRHQMMRRALFAVVFAVAIVCCGQLAQAQTLTAYYNFEGNYSDYPGTGVNADDLTTVRPGAARSRGSARSEACAWPLAC